MNCFSSEGQRFGGHKKKKKAAQRELVNHIKKEIRGPQLAHVKISTERRVHGKAERGGREMEKKSFFVLFDLVPSVFISRFAFSHACQRASIEGRGWALRWGG